MTFLIKNMGKKIFRDALKSLQGEAKARAMSQALKSQGLPPSLPARYPGDLLKGRTPPVSSHLLEILFL